MLDAYYRDIKHGRTPKTAATYVKENSQSRLEKEAEL